VNPYVILSIFLGYTALLFTIAFITGRKSSNETYFRANKSSPWYIVAYGMIGASLSGVTFISIPGEVGTSAFSYLVLVFGYLVGYAVIAQVLLPVYYKKNLTSIYSYLSDRFGDFTYKTGASFFILSRSIGASFRVYLVVNVLQVFVFDAWGIPFIVNVALFIALILLYTFRGGIKTIVWTDTLQTTFMLIALGVAIYVISDKMGLNFKSMLNLVVDSDLSKMFFTDINDKRYFVKQFISGAFIAIVMTGLDQDMMQKNLTCRNLNDAKKNIYTLSYLLIPVNIVFLFLGALLYLFSLQFGIEIPSRTDDLFPSIALLHTNAIMGIIFLFGLMAAAYSSADGSLTALTTSFSVDILGLNENKTLSEDQKVRTRKTVHISFAIFLLLLVVVFRIISDESVINKLFTIAGYTYGPLLGLFSFGLFTKLPVRDKYVPAVAILSPIFSYLLSINSEYLFNGYKFGFELLIMNGLITFIGLYLLSLKMKKRE
jgi:solute:Na+ symporter, SSS family